MVPFPTPDGPEITKIIILWGERWGSNPRQPEPQSGALPTELRSPLYDKIVHKINPFENRSLFIH